MNNISDILSRYKPNSEIGKKISKELFFIELNKKLETILKPQEIQFIKPGFIKDEYLTIYCKNTIAASIIKLKEKKILGVIEELNNPFNIKKITTKINENF